MFFGEATCNVDSQGRLVFPKIWRKPTDNDKTVFVLSPGLDLSIDVNAHEVFMNTFNKAIEASRDVVTQLNLTFYGSFCQEITLDKQGRFAISKNLLNYAQITNQADFVGTITYGRIFAKERWDKIKLNPNRQEPELTEEQIQALTEDEKKLHNIKKAIDFISQL